MFSLLPHPMKNLLAQATGAIAACQFMVGTAFAQLPEPSIIPGLPEESTTEGIKGLLIKLIQTVLDFVLLIAVIYVIVAGIRLIVSGGDEGEKDKAKQTIIYVIIGIIVILFARVIVSFVNNFFS